MAEVRMGRDVFLYWDMNHGVGARSWSKIPAQVDGGTDGSTDTVDGTTKDELGWKKPIPTENDSSLSCKARFDPADSVFTDMYAAWKAKTSSYVKTAWAAIGGTDEETKVYITKFARSFPKDNTVDVDITFSGQAAPANL